MAAVPCNGTPAIVAGLWPPFAGVLLLDWDVFKDGGGVDLLGEVVGVLKTLVLGGFDFGASVTGLHIEDLCGAGSGGELGCDGELGHGRHVVCSSKGDFVSLYWFPLAMAYYLWFVVVEAVGEWW